MSTATPVVTRFSSSRLRLLLLCLLGLAVGLLAFWAAGFLPLQRFSYRVVMVSSLVFVSFAGIAWKWYYWLRLRRRG